MEAKSQLIHEVVGRIPIIALTANAIQGDRDRCLEAGMDNYTTKPVDRESLLNMIRNSLAATTRRLDVTETPTRAIEPAVTKESTVISNVAPVAPATTAATAVSSPAPTEASTAESVFDLAELLNRCAGDQAFARKLLGRFQTRLPEERRKLTDAVAARTPDAVRLAHTIKGTAGNLAAATLHELAGELEILTRESRWEDTAPLLKQIDEEIERCQECVQRLLADDSGKPWMP